jgi:hypothetical protein
VAQPRGVAYWRHLPTDAVPGFVEFHLLEGREAEDHTIHASLTRCGKTVLCLKRGQNLRHSVPHIVGQGTTSLCIWITQFEGCEVRQTVGRGKSEVV